MKEPKHWQALQGDFDFAAGVITFRGASVVTRADDRPESSEGLAMSDVRFIGGTIEANVSWQNADSFPNIQIVVQRTTMDKSMITAGLSGSHLPGHIRSKFVVKTFNGSERTGGWRTLARTAVVPRPPSGSIALRIVQIGSLVDVYADDVHVLGHVLPMSRPASQCGLYCRSASPLTITNYGVATHRRTAFIVMQFGVPYDQLYADVIRPVVAERGFDVIRADDDFGPGLIIADVVRRIQEAEVIIADITPENQNVFYEVGYAHALGKPTILLAEKGKRLPFDVSGFRTLFYENSIAGKAAVEQGLRRHVEAITRERPAALAV